MELPDLGIDLVKDEEFGAIESALAANSLFSPVSGIIVAVNEALLEDPELINSDPYEQGWIIEIKPHDPDEFAELLDAFDYKDHLRTLVEEKY